MVTVIMALRGLSSNKLRSFLTMLGVIIGVGAVIGSTRAKAEVTIESARVPVIYVISVSRVAYPDEDVWLVCYSLDGKVETAPVPIRNEE